MKLTVFTPETAPEHTTSWDHNPKTDSQKAKTNNAGINQVPTWIRKQPRPHASNSRVSLEKKGNIFDELTICYDIFCRQHENLRASRMVYRKFVSARSFQNKSHSLDYDHTSAHLRVAKTLEKLHFSFCKPSHKRDVEAFVASCLVYFTRKNLRKKNFPNLRAWKVSFRFSTVSIDFLGPLPPSAGNPYNLLIFDPFTVIQKTNCTLLNMLAKATDKSQRR